MKKTMKYAALTAVIALAATACSKSDKGAAAEADDATAAEETVETAEEAGAAANGNEPAIDVAALALDNARESENYLTENAAREGVMSTPSGLQYMVLEEGPDTGASPVETDIVDVHYVGTLIDGVEFDSSRARGAAARFPVNQVIDGWTEALQLMSEGDKFRLFVPSALAYGESGTPGGPIGPNEALVFDVELLKVTNLERNLIAANKFLGENGARDGVTTTQSGLQYEVLAEGAADGKSPTDANVVKVNYEGRLVNGTVFDSSYDRGEPIEFPLAQVIPGWIEGVQLMSEGDKFRFFIPPSLAYGEPGTPGGPIGPNEALVFDVELLEIVD